jgi:hypothetical protein
MLKDKASKMEIWFRRHLFIGELGCNTRQRTLTHVFYISASDQKGCYSYMEIRRVNQKQK